MLRHVFILGPTGTGKSTLIIGLLTQFLDDGTPFMAFDFKRGYRCLIDTLWGESVLVVTVGRDVAPLSLNALRPPAGVGFKEWADIISTSYLLMQGARNVLMEALLGAHREHGDNATLKDAHQLLDLELRAGRAGSRRYGWLESSTRSLEELSKGGFGSALNATSAGDVGSLLQGPVVFELEGLGDEGRERVMAQEPVGRMGNQRRSQRRSFGCVRTGPRSRLGMPWSSTVDINRNPAALLHIPDGRTRERYVLTLEQARTVLNAFALRERLIIKFCGILGLRPGEALATKWGDVTAQGLRITRRVYRGVIDTPKSNKGKRLAALSESVITDLQEWRDTSPHTASDDWIFPSENGNTPLWPTNVWCDKIRPTLDTLGLAWVNFQVLRRSTASLLNQPGVEGKTVADQLGHGLDVSQNVYTQAAIKQQAHAVNLLDHALRYNTAQACD
uniref:Phage integrase family protein n=1 Tax=Solibacter usitatus (strain Ellin6076) TaxID=234267 RepID=Q023G3_SOLUE